MEEFWARKILKETWQQWHDPPRKLLRALQMFIRMSGADLWIAAHPHVLTLPDHALHGEWATGKREAYIDLHFRGTTLFLTQDDVRQWLIPPVHIS